jgi:phage terminase large subunit
MELWQQKLAAWKTSPLLFAKEALRATPEAWQAQVLADIESGETRLAIRAGHGVGKSTLEAWVILWYVLFHRPCKIPVTANSQDQLRDVLWAEISKWWRKLPPFLQTIVEVTAERVEVVANRADAFAVARTARPEKPEALAGFHSDHLLFVIDEASGIEEIIFETASGALSTPGALILMAGNPTRTTGYFWKAFHENSGSWKTYHVPCSASSRVSPNYALEIAREYGIESNVYRVRVEGEFPLTEDDSVIPLGLVESAFDRDVSPSESGVVWGLDVARFGDDSTALAKRRGNVLLEPVREWKKFDLMQTAGVIVKEYRETPLEFRPSAINVDVIGLGGGVVDRLRELGLPVRGINVGEQASFDPQRYMRLRDELWWKTREWFESRAVSMPPDRALKGELVAPKYKLESSGKIKVESKDDMKKRGVKSPNKADALCLTFAGGDLVRFEAHRATAHMSYDPFRTNDPIEYERDQMRQTNAGTDYTPF